MRVFNKQTNLSGDFGEILDISGRAEHYRDGVNSVLVGVVNLPIIQLAYLFYQRKPKTR